MREVALQGSPFTRAMGDVGEFSRLAWPRYRLRAYQERVAREIARSVMRAQARGETATLMLACNEAQDVLPARWDAVFDPMGAASHATQVFSGTVWTTRTLLARQMDYLGELERKDGAQRVFKVGWEEVARHVPEY